MASLTWLEDGVPKVARLEPGTAYVLGREESVDIPVASPAKTISRRHARISVRGATCSIENLSETNVTKLNGALIWALSGLVAISRQWRKCGARSGSFPGWALLRVPDVTRTWTAM